MKEQTSQPVLFESLLLTHTPPPVDMPSACLLVSAAQQAAQYKEEALQAGNTLEDTQRKLQDCIYLDQQKADTIQDLQREVQRLQAESVAAGEELASNRYLLLTSREPYPCEPVPVGGHQGWDIRDSPWGQLHSPTTQALKSIHLLSLCFRKQIDELTSNLSDTLGKLENSDKEKKQLQKTAEEQDQKLNDMQDQVTLVQYQVGSKQAADTKNRDLLGAKNKLEEEIPELTQTLKDKREQLKKSKENEKFLEDEIEALRQEDKKKEKMLRENLRKQEEEKGNLQEELKQCATQLEVSLSKYNASQQLIEELNLEMAQHKDAIANLQAQLDEALQKEKHCMQTMVAKEIYDNLCRKSTTCQDDLTQALEKLNQVTSETKNLQRSLLQAQDKKAHLEDEIVAYEDRMKKLNVELKKLQGFHQQSELEVHAFDKKLEEMSNQVLQWQKQHQNDLKMLAAKEMQLREFQEEMTTLKENLLADDKEVGTPGFCHFLSVHPNKAALGEEGMDQNKDPIPDSGTSERSSPDSDDLLGSPLPEYILDSLVAQPVELAN
ncbi:hypothetical protein GHT09_012971 [Marmota monax]|uniref:Uncharacterized protein n=1 Tax=Marmota monax TaxID=9995 RepID=A0A834PLV4_MARMO|nr:hypothetical protein GHT09_012971 [Marmota monax]